MRYTHETIPKHLMLTGLKHMRYYNSMTLEQLACNLELQVIIMNEHIADEPWIDSLEQHQEDTRDSPNYHKYTVEDLRQVSDDALEIINRANN